MFFARRCPFPVSFDGGAIRYGIGGRDWDFSQANSRARNFVEGYPLEQGSSLLYLLAFPLRLVILKDSGYLVMGCLDYSLGKHLAEVEASPFRSSSYLRFSP